MKTPLKLLLEELKSSRLTCENENQKSVYDATIERIEILIPEETKILKGVYLDGKLSAYHCLIYEEDNITAEEYLKSKPW